jgi:class 3 adenylate cyclase/tetratricopeptide (TPR) repeat protein
MPATAAAARKTVTVLFCDLAGSTELGERLDPEALGELMGRWYAAMRDPVERHGGTVEKFVGDAVMAVFGIPRLHEDDALRAVRAAVEMRMALARLNADLPGRRKRELRMRIGINTGEVVTGDGRTTLVTGDAVNTAKRLEESAGDDEILIGDTTRRLVANATELEPAPPVAAKGKRRPVGAWRVLGTIAGAAAFARRLDAPLVGRAGELAFLREELAAAERDRSCRLVTVYGAAGIGKSRLAAELVNEVAGRAAVLTARVLPYGDGLTFQPLAELVHPAGGDDAILAAVEAEPDGALILERVHGAIGPGGAPASSEETFWAIRRLLETVAHQRPLVVRLEDVHWAQPTFLDLLEYVAGWSRDAPILLLCLARPELLDDRPRWAGASLHLEPLTEAESQLLLDELAVEWPLAREARQRIADAAEGNPLFVEQMVAMLAEHGSETVEIPPTIQALLAARLDRLEPEEREVLERASVIGKEFWRGAVAALAGETEGGEVAQVLLALVRKELVRPEPSAFLGDDGFRFRHALIRDATYAAIPKSTRADLHERFAGWLEQREGEDELLGYHLEQAYVYRAELGRFDDALAERAGELLGAAGSRAAARGDAAAALTLLRRSLALLPPPHPSRIELLRELSAALWIDGDVDAAELVLSDSIHAARAAGDTRLEWYGRLERGARNATANGDTTALVTIAESAVRVFDDLGDDLGLARAWRRLGLVAHTEHRFGDAAAAFERALAHAEASGDEQERARSADALCTALLYGPARVVDAVARAEAILAAAETNTVLRAHVSTSLAALVAMEGEFDRARELYTEAGTVYEKLGLRLPWAGWTVVAGSIELLAGDPVAAAKVMLAGYDLLDDGGHESLRAYHAGMLAFLLAGEGEGVEAQRFVVACPPGSIVGAHDTAARLRAAQAMLVDHRLDAERLAREAVALSERTDDLNLQAAMHLTVARITGDPEEAAAARRLYESKGNVVAAAAAARVIVGTT